MSGVEIVKVKKADEGMRLNRWFLKYYPLLTMGRLQKLLRTKQIKVDGKKAEANLKLSLGQEIRIPPLDNEKAQNKSINLFTDWIKAFKILIFDLKSKIQTKLILRIVI